MQMQLFSVFCSWPSYCLTWSPLWTNTQRISDNLKPSPTSVTVTMNRHRPVLGLRDNICALSQPGGSAQSKSSTKWCMATRMYAPWLTTMAWTGRARTPSSAFPSTGDVSAGADAGFLSARQCWSQSCSSIFPRNSLTRSFTWPERNIC